MKSKTEHAKLMSEALSDLNMLGAIITLCTSSLMHDCNTAEQQIVKICNARSQYLLRRYDWHLAQIESDK